LILAGVLAFLVFYAVPVHSRQGPSDANTPPHPPRGLESIPYLPGYADKSGDAVESTAAPQALPSWSKLVFQRLQNQVDWELEPANNHADSRLRITNTHYFPVVLFRQR